MNHASSLCRSLVLAATLHGATLSFAEPSAFAPAAASDIQAQKDRLERGLTLLLKDKRPAEAIDCCFAPVIEFYERRADSGSTLYSSRSPAEALTYLLAAAAARTKAVVVDSSYGYAYFLKAYAQVELGQASAARSTIGKAISISPQNSQFLSEQAHLLVLEKDWDSALVGYQKAEAAAKSFSPEEDKTAELGKALRGRGYVLIEMGKLEEAEKVYEECIVLDKSDRAAAAELTYIRDLRTKRGR